MIECYIFVFFPGPGQGLECSACASITTPIASSLGECNDGNLPKITCYENKTSCARATIDGNN